MIQHKHKYSGLYCYYSRENGRMTTKRGDVANVDLLMCLDEWWRGLGS